MLIAMKLGAQTGMNPLLEILPIGIVLLNKEERISYSNQIAKQIIAEEDGLIKDRNDLQASDPCENQQLHHLITKVISARDETYRSINQSLTLSRSSGRIALGLFVVSLSEESLSELNYDQAAAAILIRDPEKNIQSCQERLIQFYGLTPSEARVAACLIHGQSVQEIAGQMEVQSNTIRAHLKHIYRKTETRRQAELAGVLFTNPLLSL